MALHAEAYGEPVDAMTLIPHMLEAFIARDRASKKGVTPVWQFKHNVPSES
ncbi:MAG: hypothetical protein JWR80_6344 [Bradyrhizobium sp.]|nr:hypothetical protein [Bradyrhizobium sp.]